MTRAVISEPKESTDGAGGPYMVALTVQHEGESKTSLTLELTLTEIDGPRYADLFLARAERDRLVGTYGFLAVPVHQVMKLSRDGDELRVDASSWPKRRRSPCARTSRSSRGWSA